MGSNETHCSAANRGSQPGWHGRLPHAPGSVGHLVLCRLALTWWQQVCVLTPAEPGRRWAGAGEAGHGRLS